jgi:hypothetical protein
MGSGPRSRQHRAGRGQLLAPMTRRMTPLNRVASFGRRLVCSPIPSGRDVGRNVILLSAKRPSYGRMASSIAVGGALRRLRLRLRRCDESPRRRRNRVLRRSELRRRDITRRHESVWFALPCESSSPCLGVCPLRCRLRIRPESESGVQLGLPVLVAPMDATILRELPGRPVSDGCTIVLGHERMLCGGPRVLFRRDWLQLRCWAIRHGPTVLVLLSGARRLPGDAAASRDPVRSPWTELHLRRLLRTIPRLQRRFLAIRRRKLHVATCGPWSAAEARSLSKAQPRKRDPGFDD